jgi:hypothetical protein
VNGTQKPEQGRHTVEIDFARRKEGKKYRGAIDGTIVGGARRKSGGRNMAEGGKGLLSHATSSKADMKRRRVDPIAIIARCSD